MASTHACPHAEALSAEYKKVELRRVRRLNIIFFLPLLLTGGFLTNQDQLLLYGCPAGIPDMKQAMKGQIAMAGGFSIVVFGVVLAGCIDVIVETVHTYRSDHGTDTSPSNYSTSNYSTNTTTPNATAIPTSCGGADTTVVPRKLPGDILSWWGPPLAAMFNFVREMEGEDLPRPSPSSWHRV